MKVELIRTFRFEAAHALPNAPKGHKCRRIHGHNYRVDVHLYGEVDPLTGWLMDFGDVKKAVDPLIDQLDHRYLNDIDGLENVTSELLAKWLWDRLRDSVPHLSAVEVWESDASRCVYRGE